MKIYLNGTQVELDTGCSLLQVIEREGLLGKRIAVEVNEVLITRSEHPDCILNDGDRIEIVQAIGGG